jgi:hypothetical protein
MAGVFQRGPVMLRSAIACLIAAVFVVATTFANPSAAETHRKHIVKHEVERTVPPYGAPANYYPAPPFPFFLLPGPWWLPAHS